MYAKYNILSKHLRYLQRVQTWKFYDNNQKKKIKTTKITFHFRISIFYTISETVNLTYNIQ